MGTQMLRAPLAGGAAGARKIAAQGQVLSPAEVASAAIRSLKNGNFLVRRIRERCAAESED